MDGIPELRFKSLPKNFIKFNKYIAEISYAAFDSLTKNSKTSFHSNLKKNFDSQSSRKNLSGSFSPDPYVISINTELKKASYYIKQRNNTPVPIIAKPVVKMPTIKYLNREEQAIRGFIEAIFSNEQSVYRKSKISSELADANVISAEKMLLEAKKIIKSGIKKKKIQHNLNDDVETFWKTNISKEKTVRWDIFEDSLISYITSYMVTEFAIIRKVDWRNFLNILFKKISKQSDFCNVWVSSPAFTLKAKAKHFTVSLKDLSTAVLNLDLVKAMYNSVCEQSSHLVRHKEDEKYSYSCGCSYRGQWNGGKREGNGVLELCSGETYKGSFSSDNFHDFGSLEFEKLSYKGYFRKGKFSEFGILKYPDGSSFEGLFLKGAYTKGLLKWPRGKFYKGEFSNEVFEGRGRLVAQHEVSKGHWLNGKLNGECSVKRKDGTKVKGVFIDGVLSTKGKLTCSEYVYKGDFTDSRPNGTGEFYFKSGIEYRGEVKNGLIDGEGLMKYPNGDSYEGWFVKSEQTGKGKIAYANGNVYEGEVENGRPNGLGTFFFADGNNGAVEKYCGEVKNGQIDGNGEAWLRDGGYYNGQWAEGKIEGIGVWKKNGFVYDGEISNGAFNGYGKIKYGIAYYSGLWVRGRPNGNGEIKDVYDNCFFGVFKDGVPVLKHNVDKEFLDSISNLKLFS